MRSLRHHLTPPVIIAGIAVLGALGAILWVLLLVRSEDSPLDPATEPPVSPVSSPVATPAATAGATPIAPVSIVPTEVPGSVPDLLTYAPDRLAGNSLPLSDIARYADIEGWMRARGVAMPSGPDDPAFDAWEDELAALALPDIFVARAVDSAWQDTYGFQLTDVDQVLAVGQAPDYVIVMRGDFDAAALQAAWVQSGYQAVATQGVTIWSLFPGDEVDLSAPASRPALGNLNNIVVLEDGTMLATSRLSRMEETLRVVRGEDPSLADNAAIAALLRPGGGAESLVTAVIVKGTVLAMDPGTPEPATPPARSVVDASTPASTPAAPSPMPPADLVLAGLERPTEGESPRVMRLVVAYPSAEDATLALSRADRSIRHETSDVTNAPYTHRLAPLGSRVIGTGDDAALLVVRAEPLAGAADWRTILDERDLGFLMWPWEPDD